jgi:hypothetical protein
MAHKGIDPQVIPTRFADVAPIRRLSGQDLVPIIKDDSSGPDGRATQQVST